MKKKIVWLMISSLMVLSLVLASCATAPTPTPTPSSTPAPTPTPTATPTPKPAPAPSPGAPQYGGTITLRKLKFTNFDPYQYDGESCKATSYVWEKMAMGDWGLDRNKYNFPVAIGQIPIQYMKGCLAESWEMPDSLTIILHVRKGVNFQDKPPVNGRELTADDVVWNYKRYIAGPFTAKDQIQYIDTVTARDKYTVEMKLKPPAQVELLRGILDTQGLLMVAKECLGASGVIEDWKKIIGTGPFMITDFVPDSAVTFNKNPNYWGYDELHLENRLPYADGVKVLIIKDLSTWMSALRTGQIDQSEEIAWQDADSLKKTNPNMQMKMNPKYDAVIFTPRHDKAPFTDVRVRQALDMCLDRITIAKTFYGGHAYPYLGYVNRHFSEHTPYDKLPDTPKWTSLSVKEVLSYNPEKAKKLLFEAGYPNGFKTNIVTRSDRDIGHSEVFAFYLKAIGIESEIRVYESGVHETMMSGKTYDQLIFNSVVQKGQPLDLLARLRQPELRTNVGNVNDPTFNKMMDECVQTFDDAKRAQIVHELDMYTLENAFIISMPHVDDATVWQPWVGGYSGEGFLGAYHKGGLIARLWIDRDLKRTALGR